MMNKSVVLFSGGMDSYTLLMDLHLRGRKVYAISFDYGQQHSKELTYAAAACEQNDIPHKIIDISECGLILTSALTGGGDSIVVPNRNMIMLSMACGYAISIGATEVLFGSNASDHAVFPDCRPSFIEKLNLALEHGNNEKITVEAPYSRMSKRDIAAEGKNMGLDYTKTWTCYRGGEAACGECESCKARKLALDIFS